MNGETPSRRMRPKELQLSPREARIYRGTRMYFPWRNIRVTATGNINEYIARHLEDAAQAPAEGDQPEAEGQSWMGMLINHGWYWCHNEDGNEVREEPLMCVHVYWWGHAGKNERACTWEMVWPGRWSERLSQYLLARTLDSRNNYIMGAGGAALQLQRLKSLPRQAASLEMRELEKACSPVPALNMLYEVADDFMGLREMGPDEPITYPTLLYNVPQVPLAPSQQDEGWESESDMEEEEDLGECHLREAFPAAGKPSSQGYSNIGGLPMARGGKICVRLPE